MTDNHSQLLAAYKDIAAILDKYDLPYYGAYGTAIGAVRHKGFIPWDDDLDLVIFAKDLDRINEVLEAELDKDKYYYHNPSADSHPHVIIKTENFIEDIKNQKASFIDLFVLMDFPKSIIRQGLMYPFCGFELLSHKILGDHDSGIVKAIFYPIELISRKMIRFFSTSKTDLVSLRAVQVRKHVWKKSDYGTPVVVDFEDTTIPLPEKYHEMLTNFYGDYMTPPPEDQRTGAAGYPYSLLNDYLEDQGERKKHRRLSSKDLPK